jgi:hypothetical protein
LVCLDQEKSGNPFRQLPPELVTVRWVLLDQRCSINRLPDFCWFNIPKWEEMFYQMTTWFHGNFLKSICTLIKCTKWP